MAFVFAFVKIRFSHDAAEIYNPFPGTDSIRSKILFFNPNLNDGKLLNEQIDSSPNPFLAILLDQSQPLTAKYSSALAQTIRMSIFFKYVRTNEAKYCYTPPYIVRTALKIQDGGHDSCGKKSCLKNKQILVN